MEKMELWKMEMVLLWMLGGMEKHKFDKQKNTSSSTLSYST